MRVVICVFLCILACALVFGCGGDTRPELDLDLGTPDADVGPDSQATDSRAADWGARDSTPPDSRASDTRGPDSPAGSFPLTVTVQGKGSVESSPTGIQCPPACTVSYSNGTVVTLTAKPAVGWQLVAWTGACTGKASCTVTVSAAQSVGATFGLIVKGWDPSFGSGDCQTAWTSGLSPCDKTPDDYVVVRKSARNLALCKSGAHVTNFRVGLGFAPVGDKEKSGDGKTPEGVFYIPRLVPNSSYYKAFLLSYPDKDDAQRGLTTGLITQSQKTQIDSAQNACLEPPQSTSLGGLIELHGNGGSSDWTWGCIAVEDSQIDQLWAVLGVNDTIVVLP